jgi:hypothetical protein
MILIETYTTISIFAAALEVKRIVFFLLLVVNIAFVAFVYISRYLTRHDHHHHNDDFDQEQGEK